MAKYCTNCGAKLEEGQDVCLKCGHNVRKDFGQTINDTINPSGGKSRLVAGLLGILLGGLGIHNFYLGNTGRGVAQLILSCLTFGIASIWGFIEGILILVGQINEDSDGNQLI